MPGCSRGDRAADPCAAPQGLAVDCGMLLDNDVTPAADPRASALLRTTRARLAGCVLICARLAATKTPAVPVGTQMHIRVAVAKSRRAGVF